MKITINNVSFFIHYFEKLKIIFIINSKNYKNFNNFIMFIIKKSKMFFFFINNFKYFYLKYLCISILVQYFKYFPI